MSYSDLDYSAPQITREETLKINICGAHVHCRNLENDGFTILALNEEYAEKIFTRDVKSRLEEDKFSPLMPAELRVRKSVILIRVGDVIYEWEEDEITDELKIKNTWMDDKLLSIFKFSNSNTLELTFTQT